MMKNPEDWYVYIIFGTWEREREIEIWKRWARGKACMLLEKAEGKPSWLNIYPLPPPHHEVWTIHINALLFLFSLSLSHSSLSFPQLCHRKKNEYLIVLFWSSFTAIDTDPFTCFYVMYPLCLYMPTLLGSFTLLVNLQTKII